MSHNEKLKRMIDERRIEEAAINKCGFISSEFYSGAKWMQEEFLKNLWHDVDEMPKRAKAFIFECGDDSMNYYIGMMFNPNDYKKMLKYGT